jgi:hypothetical protein
MAFSSGCLSNETISDPNGGGGQEPVDHEASLVVTNVGDGVGSVAVRFAAGAVTDGCRNDLDPGESCTVAVEHTAAISSVSVSVEPGDFSTFGGFGDDCTGTTPQCTISWSETTINLSVDVAFDLGVARIDFQPDTVRIAAGADATLVAAAFADPAGTRPVAQAAFTWESSNAAIASVESGTGGAATVSGRAAGVAWIRATARNGTDSVKVVVGG